MESQEMPEFCRDSSDLLGGRATPDLLGSTVDSHSAADPSTGPAVLGPGRPGAPAIAGATQVRGEEIAPSRRDRTLRVSSLTAHHLNHHVRIGSNGTGDGVQGRLFAVRHERAWSVVELSVMNQSVTIQIPHAGDGVELTLLDDAPADR